MIVLPTITIAQKNSTPPLAASTKTWTFCGLTWSDMIEVPNCRKASFTTNGSPDCRYLTTPNNTITCYYYNWHYVVRYAETLCPYPWRVPTLEDVPDLVKIPSFVLKNDWIRCGCYDHRGEFREDGKYISWTTDEGATSIYKLNANGKLYLHEIITYGEAIREIGAYWSPDESVVSLYGLPLRCVK